MRPGRLKVVNVPLQHHALRRRRCANAGSVERSNYRIGTVRNDCPLNEMTANGNSAASADGRLCLFGSHRDRFRGGKRTAR